MTDDIDTEVLISLVEAKPVLWDKSLEIYRDKNGTRQAWEEVFTELKSDFSNLEDQDKIAFGKEVIRRWTNVRDAFAKFCKREKTKSKHKGSKHKKYVYSDHLKFLKKIYTTKDMQENLEKDDREIDNTEIDGDIDNDVDSSQTTRIRSADQDLGSAPKKHHKPNELELMMLKALENDKPNRHLSFFHGVMPALEKFNEHEVLKFQMGVLQLISQITEKKLRVSQSPLPLQPPIPSSQPATCTHPHVYILPQGHQPPQSSFQCYQNFNQPASLNPTTPLDQPLESPSPAQSTSSSYNSVDFLTLSPKSELISPKPELITPN